MHAESNAARGSGACRLCAADLMRLNSFQKPQ